MSAFPSISRKALDPDVKRVSVQIDTGSYSYTVDFLANGAGVVHTPDGEVMETFTHGYAVEEDLADREPETLSEEYVQRFWDEINAQLDDPFIRDFDELAGEPLHFARGDEEEFRRRVLEFVLTEPEQPDFSEIRVTAAADDEGCEWHADGDEPVTERLGLLIALLCEEMEPSGYTWEYNDGASDQVSGYSQSPESIWIEIEDVSAHERADAIVRFLEWLAPRRHKFAPGQLALIAGHLEDQDAAQSHPDLA